MSEEPAREVARRGPVLRLTAPPGGRARWPSQLEFRLLCGGLEGSQPPGFAELPQQQRGSKATLRDGKAHIGARARRYRDRCAPRRGRDAAACGRQGKSRNVDSAELSSAITSWSPARKAVRSVLRTCTGTLCSVRTRLRSVVASRRDIRHQASVGLRIESTRRWDAVVGSGTAGGCASGTGANVLRIRWNARVHAAAPTARPQRLPRPRARRPPLTTLSGPDEVVASVFSTMRPKVRRITPLVHGCRR